MKKVALITGGSRGIGYGIATKLAAEGYALVINGIRPAAEVSEALGELKRAGAEPLYCQGNIASPQERKIILDTIRKHFGRLNLLVNNAGMAPRERRDLLETTEASFDEVMGANLKGAFFLTQDFANWAIGEKRKDPGYQAMVINISSISATVASVNRGEYCISKAGMSMMTQLFAVRLGEYNIPVFEIRPGIIETDMTAGVKEKYDRLINDGLTVQKRWGTPEDVGRAVSALVSGKFPYSTGQVIMVDGGMTIPKL